MITTKYMETVGRDHKIYKENTPFPHIVLDNFLEQSDFLNTVVSEIQDLPNDVYDFNEHAQVQIKKRGLSDVHKMPPLTKQVVDFFLSDIMVQYLEKLTGIPNLIPDTSLMGGGIHKTENGGHLSVHADFNIHPTTGLHRRLNLLFFLNPIWEKEWNGCLELWDSQMTKCVESIIPILNRVVIFRITDDAYHGHPDPLNTPPSISRYSLAFYYYTKDRPESEKNPFHWASWKMRPDGRF